MNLLIYQHIHTHAQKLFNAIAIEIVYIYICCVLYRYRFMYKWKRIKQWTKGWKKIIHFVFCNENACNYFDYIIFHLRS